MSPARLRGTGGLDGVERIGLAALAPGLAVLAVHFDDVDSRSGEVTRDAGPIGPGAFHSDLGDLTEHVQPGQQGRVAVGVGPKRLGAEQATDLVQDGGHMDLAVGVDATGDRARGFYDGHAIPSFLKRLRGGAAVPRRSDGVGRSGLNRPANHPSGTGHAAPYLMCPELRSTGCGRHVTST